ncbi:MAG: LytTR family DNA-binding domain-containing protein [Lachnospiraceae bacterium]|nr:LytTR family DNA-binding domain-containing protein [Lachnospiraceae bacterium]
MQITLVDDDPKMRQQLASYVGRFGAENGSCFELLSFGSGDELLEDYQPDHDIIILDIDMPGTNGLNTARKIRQLDNEVQIMFVTNIAQYAINGYEVEAVDYVLKPVGYYDFAMKLGRALRKVRQRRPDRLVLNAQTGPVQVNAEDILYVEVMGHYLIYHTAKVEHQVRGSFKEQETLLKKYHFSRCHKSYMVNLVHVKNIRSQGVILHDRVVPIGRSYKELLMEDYIAFLHG